MVVEIGVMPVSTQTPQISDCKFFLTVFWHLQ